jgi:stage V sporulation protein R
MPKLESQLPPRLERARGGILEHARSFGLDPFETVFLVLDYRQVNQTAAYGGFPQRYPHWRFGMEYDRLSKSYTFGMHRIYEMVINNDPCYAYLLESNADVVQRLVMAHVYGHSDFFKHNMWFAETNRRMMDEMANHATRVRRYVDRHGLETVEDFVDACLSLENLIDPHSQFFRRDAGDEGKAAAAADDDDEPQRAEVRRLPGKKYMDRYLNPPEFLAEQQRRVDEMEAREGAFPPYPVKDVLKFILLNAPLASWQQDVLAMVRDEAYYFVPQRQTKIMNEGWATFWHSRIMTEKVLEPGEVLDYAEVHAGTLGTQPGVVNPYKLGLELFRDIEDRWNRGAFGAEYEDCTDPEKRRRWNTEVGLGAEKVFEVRRLHSDITFIDTYLTEDFCERQKMFTYEFNARTGQYEIASRDFQAVKDKLVGSLTNFGEPEIYVVDGNFRNRGELYLKHRYTGVELRHDHAVETLRSCAVLWRRPVRLETVVDEKLRLLGHDGRELTDEALGGTDYVI